MAGLRAFSAFLPYSRTKSSAEAGFVAGDDEDAITLAVAAALPIVEAHRAAKGALSGISFASPSAASGAALVATACDAAIERARGTDFCGDGRAGVQALIAAHERLGADPMCADVLIAVGDEDKGCAAGAALIVGRREPCAEILATHSVLAENEESFLLSMKGAISGALASAAVMPRDVARYVIGAPNTELALQLMDATGMERQKLTALGSGAGCALPLVSLVAALDASVAGDVVVLAAWGAGADAIVFRVTQPQRSPRALAAQLAAGLEGPHALGQGEALADLRLRGARCSHCDALRASAASPCVCGQTAAEPVRLGRAGRIGGFTVEGAPLVELESGGRVAVALTDAGPIPPRLGARVELVLRSTPDGYGWKARPIR